MTFLRVTHHETPTQFIVVAFPLNHIGLECFDDCTRSLTQCVESIYTRNVNNKKEHKIRSPIHKIEMEEKLIKKTFTVSSVTLV